MKIQDFHKVKFLMEARSRLLSAIDNTEKALEKVTSEANRAVHSVDLPKYTAGGYSMSVSMYSDGSGAGADLHGCYVAIPVVKATLQILQDKLAETDQVLINHGVDMGDESDDHDELISLLEK